MIAFDQEDQYALELEEKTNSKVHVYASAHHRMFANFSAISLRHLNHVCNRLCMKSHRERPRHIQNGEDTDGKFRTADVMSTIFSDLPRTVRITFASSILSYKFSHCQLVGLKLHRTDFNSLESTRLSRYEGEI